MIIEANIYRVLLPRHCSKTSSCINLLNLTTTRGSRHCVTPFCSREKLRHEEVAVTVKDGKWPSQNVNQFALGTAFLILNLIHGRIMYYQSEHRGTQLSSAVSCRHTPERIFK